jgi:hypothetical protein
MRLKTGISRQALSTSSYGTEEEFQRQMRLFVRIKVLFELESPAALVASKISLRELNFYMIFCYPYMGLEMDL